MQRSPSPAVRSPQRSPGVPAANLTTTHTFTRDTPGPNRRREGRAGRSGRPPDRDARALAGITDGSHPVFGPGVCVKVCVVLRLVVVGWSRLVHPVTFTTMWPDRTRLSPNQWRIEQRYRHSPRPRSNQGRGRPPLSGAVGSTCRAL